eukprot:m.56278 g.56278  ORF g.56278 m.56278 type:complete len:256 (+) comp15577_c0_seq1:112-879(+)
MSDDDWEDDWENAAAPVAPSKHWDDEEDEAEVEEVTAASVNPNSKYAKFTIEELVKELEKRDRDAKDPSKSTGAKARRKALKEKEEAERERRRLAEEAEEESAEEAYKRKLEERLRAEAADLEVSKDLFGDPVEVVKQEEAGAPTFETMDPLTDAEFDAFGTLITTKLDNYSAIPGYVTFLTNLTRDLVAGLSVEDIRKISSSLGIVANEKQKASKGKQKPKNKKAQLGGAGKGGTGSRARAFDDYAGDEFDDFM